MDTQFQIREINDTDKKWILDTLEKQWGSSKVVSRGKLHDASKLPGFIATKDGLQVGLVTYKVEGQSCEVVTLNSLAEGIGAGAGLLQAVIDKAKNLACSRVWLITTNDNTQAINYYQNRGFKLIRIHKNAVEKSRKLKPEIPDLGIAGVPIRDEIELEMILTPKLD